MPETNPQQISFGGGINAVAPAHLVGEDQVQTATNIDFSIERGAASVRRGSTHYQTVSTDTIEAILPNYNNDSLQSTPYYFVTSSNVYRGTLGGTGSATLTAISTVGGAVVGSGVFRDNVYFGFAAATNNIQDNGTASTQWIKQHPTTALAVTAVSPLPWLVASTYALREGTLVGTSTDTLVTYDGTGGTTTATFTLMTATTDAATNRITFWGGPVGSMENAGTYAIGDYGVDHLMIKFSNPSVVSRVSRDYSINGTTYKDYWHTEMPMNLSEFLDMDVTGYTKDAALPDSSVLVNSELNVGTTTDTHVNLDDRAEMLSVARRSVRAPKMRISAAADTYNDWAVPRTKFEYVGPSSTPQGWGTIGEMRVVIECDEACQVALGEWTVRGANAFPLTDVEVGVAYWETFASIDTNTSSPTYLAKFAESAPSPPSARLKVQGAAIKLVSTNTVTGTLSDLTHRIIYRQGGYLADAYAVATNSLAVTTFTDTLPDVRALSINNRLNRNILSRSAFPGNVRTIGGFKERLFVGYDNQIRWSLPAQPHTFPITSRQQVSNYGDNVLGLFPEAPVMVIVNRDSVYELQGNNFEGKDADYIIYRTSARTGSKAPRSLIRTPYGILLLNYDGLSLYQPGGGIEQPITWAMERMADVFKGNAVWDIAHIKGQRIPALNLGAINHSCATFVDDKIYLAMPCGFQQLTNNYVFVLDFRTQQVQVYKYPWAISCLFWDFIENTLMAGTTDGNVMRLEQKDYDTLTNGTATGIDYSLLSRAVTTPQDLVVENISVEHKGGQSVVYGIYDGTDTQTLGTLTNTNSKDWLHPAMLGSYANNVAFKFAGTQAYSTNLSTTSTHYQQALYNIQWDALVEPKRVTFWKTEYERPVPEGEALWDVHHADLEVIGTGTVTATVYLNGTAVMTRTDLTGPTSGRLPRPFAYQPDTTGKIGHTVYTAGSGVVFKHWATTNNVRPEPPRVNSVEWGPFSYPSKRFLRTWVAELNPDGTCVGVVTADGTVIATATFTGSRHTTYNHGLDYYLGTLATALSTAIDIKVVYTGTGLKHYQTQIEAEPLPFHKTSWSITYKKVGGATQLDLARFWSFDIEVPTAGTATITAAWDIDGEEFQIGTFTSTGTRWRDRIAFEPGARGYLFQQRIKSDVPIHVWKSNIDIMRVGIKGLSRSTIPGTPRE